MRLSFKDKQIALRDAHLARERQLYARAPYGTFNKIKDWDDKGRIVIWEGTIVSPELRDRYKVQIHYGAAYPYKRPNVYPLEPRIENQRHQEPTSGRPDLPGGLCLLPHNPDRWVVGLTCHDLVERAIVWLKAYENKTLDQEFAPPEIERFFPPANQLRKPGILLVNSLLATKTTEHSGGCLLMPTKSGKFGFLYLFGEVDTDAAIQELTRLLSLILPGESLAKDGWLTGDWFDLDREPKMPVPLSSAAFLDLLERSGRASSERLALAKKKPQILAVRYPTTVGVHWLIFQSKFTFPARSGFRKETFEIKVREVNKSNPLKLYSAYHINPETIFRRVSGYEVEKLQKKKCILLGCGSIGSRIGEVLIKSGVGSLALIDKEEMRAGNVSRHVLGLDYIGRNKAEGLKEFLHKRNPDAKIGAFPLDTLSAPEALSELVKQSDLIISCLGNDAAELFASSVALSDNKPIIYCRSFLKGTLGQIFLSQPAYHPACFNCASSYLDSPDCPVPRVPQLPYTELVGLDGDCGAAFIPASGVDLDLISLHGARIALALLQDQQIPANYWLVRGREFGPEEYPEIAAELREPFRQHAYSISASSDCENCQLSLGMNEKKHQHETACCLLIHRSVLEFIETESAKALRTETGGVLAGFGDAAAGEIHVTHASKPGPRARKTMFSFARDTEYCQEFLDSVARQSGGAIDYLGEWHKHHEHVPQPSGTDVTTSKKIALSSDYHVSRCLLLIVGESNSRTSLRAFVVDSSGASMRTNWELCTACDTLLPEAQTIYDRESDFQS